MIFRTAITLALVLAAVPAAAQDQAPPPAAQPTQPAQEEGLSVTVTDESAWQDLQVAIPAFAKVGAGLRISGDHTRPYATIAFPLVPKLAAKGNIGPKYYAVGLTLGY